MNEREDIPVEGGKLTAERVDERHIMSERHNVQLLVMMRVGECVTDALEKHADESVSRRVKNVLAQHGSIYVWDRTGSIQLDVEFAIERSYQEGQ